MSRPARFCLVTGAGGGIGRALVDVFGEDGYEVIGLDQGAAPAGLKCSQWLRCDLKELVNDERRAATLFRDVGRIAGESGLHVLINNAATQVLGGVDTLTRLDWRATLDINLIAPFLLAQGLLPLLERARGSIVNIGSIHARLTKPGFVAYATSKAALGGLTRAMAVDLGSRVRVNAIEPAAVQTGMLVAGFHGRDEEFRQLVNAHPARRIGDPREVAVLARLMTDDRMRFVHGATVAIDGGIGARLHDPC